MSDMFVYLPGNLMHTNPPLTITEEQLRESFVHIDKALDVADTFCD
jgi:hypothetical protein